MMDSEKNPTLPVVIFLYSSRFVTSMHLFPERAECWMEYILLWILYLYLFVIHNLRDFFLKQHLLHDIVVGFIFKVISSLNTIAMLFSVFDLWILIDRCHLCVPTVHCEGTSRYTIIQIPEVPVPSL
jgi:hypothetical protein